MTKTAILLAGVLLIAVGGCTETDIKTLAESARAGDQEAQYQLNQAAEQGDAEAQYSLGYAYYSGEGVVQNYAEARRWFRKAAEQGHAEAQFFTGRGLAEMDDKGAVHWYRKAAKQGHASAQMWLGHAYYSGEGVGKDYVEAARWFRKAAEQGHAEAQFQLGVLYRFGMGIPEHEGEAVRWWRKAAEQGHAMGQARLGYWYDMQNKADSAVYWITEAAMQGELIGWPVQIWLGRAYRDGEGVEQNYIESYAWFSVDKAWRSKSRYESKESEELRALNDRMTAGQIEAAQDRALELHLEIESRKAGQK